MNWIPSEAEKGMQEGIALNLDIQQSLRPVFAAAIDLLQYQYRRLSGP